MTRAILVLVICMFVVTCNSSSQSPERRVTTEAASPTLATPPVVRSTIALTPTSVPQPTPTPIGIYSESDDRSNYKDINLETTDIQPWSKTFQDAVDQKAIWLEQPVRVVQFFFLSTRAEWPATFEKISYIPTESGKAIIIIVVPAFSDSTSAFKYRAELEQEGNYWKITWIGQAHKCGRGTQEELKTKWHTQPCL